MSLKFKRNLPILLLLVALLSFLTLAMGTQPICAYSLTLETQVAGQALQPTPSLNQSTGGLLEQGSSVQEESSAIAPSINAQDDLVQ